MTPQRYARHVLSRCRATSAAVHIAPPLAPKPCCVVAAGSCSACTRCSLCVCACVRAALESCLRAWPMAELRVPVLDLGNTPTEELVAALRTARLRACVRPRRSAPLTPPPAALRLAGLLRCAGVHGRRLLLRGEPRRGRGADGRGVRGRRGVLRAAARSKGGGARHGGDEQPRLDGARGRDARPGAAVSRRHEGRILCWAARRRRLGGGGAAAARPQRVARRRAAARLARRHAALLRRLPRARHAAGAMPLRRACECTGGFGAASFSC